MSKHCANTCLAEVELSGNYLTSLSIFSLLVHSSSCLVSLNLRNNDAEMNNLHFLHHLPLLSTLALKGTTVGDPNWLHAISSLPSLKELDLSHCNLPQPTPSSVNFSPNSSSQTLAKVDLSSNYLTRPIFYWLAKFSSSLVSLNLGNNQLDGHIPEPFGNLILLEHLDMSYINLGEVSETFGNSSNLKFLDSEVPETFGNLSNLKFLDMSYNNLSEVPETFGNLSNLIKLDMSYNKLGKVPETFGNLRNLKFLDMSHNMYKGNISESHFSNLRNLKVMDLSFSSFALHLINPDWIPPFQLQELKLTCCSTGPQFPNWIRTQNNLSHLDLSKNGIIGPVPEWFPNISPKLKYLNLSDNQLSGSFPDLSSRFVNYFICDISSNKFSGSLPIFHPMSASLQLSRNMFTGPISSICTYGRIGLLDLSNNQLSGELPPCWSNMSPLCILDLSNNKLSGKIQGILGVDFVVDFLKALVLRNNNLSGELPLFLKDRSSLKILDVGGNHLIGSIPKWVGTHLTELKVLGLSDNKFHGMIPPEMCHLTEIQILDLSTNNISGRIPNCFSNFTSLAHYDIIPKSLRGPNGIGGTGDGFYVDLDVYVDRIFLNWKGKKNTEYGKNARFLKLIDISSNKLVGGIPKELYLLRGLVSLNLSRNQLIGRIDANIGQMQELQSLDLSGNHLSGEIPVGLARLTFLEVLDLSNNNLSGSIPSGPQLQSFDASTYAGNDGLCGLPLAPCAIPAHPRSSFTENKKHNLLDKGFYISAACGFVTGFWGIIIVFFFTSAWRNALYNFWNWAYVMTVIHTRRLR